MEVQPTTNIILATSIFSIQLMICKLLREVVMVVYSSKL